MENLYKNCKVGVRKLIRFHNTIRCFFQVTFIRSKVNIEKGNARLQLAAKYLKQSMRKGGDKFISVLEGISDRADCMSAARKILYTHQCLYCSAGGSGGYRKLNSLGGYMAVSAKRQHAGIFL
jgi:hypothetical protein